MNMDIKINGNLQVQNEYITKQPEVENGKNSQSKKAVLERNIGAFKKVAGYSFDKSGLYNATGENVADSIDESEKNIVNDNKSASMIECIDTLRTMVTPEDYSALEEWGLVPDEDNPESFVSVYERIQIELAAYCDDYNISGLNINKEKMKAVLGSETMTNALKRANALRTMGKLTEESKKYILENSMASTLENIYKAVHSGGSLNKATLIDSQWQQLMPEVHKFFDKNGIEDNSGNMDTAKWIISENLPLNVENFNKLTELNKVDFSDDSYMENLKENIGYTIYFGGEGIEVDVTGEAYDTDKLTEAVNTVQSAMDSDVDYILKNNKKLNIENLKHQIKERQKREFKEEASNSKNSNKILQEARAVLTAGSLFMIQKAGVSITFTEITVLVDMSVNNNESFAEDIFMLDGSISDKTERNVLTETMEVMSGFRSLPVGVAGKIYSGEISYTAKAVYTEGKLMTTKFSMAIESYETIGTEVRGDLGDNILKAFRNIDDILVAEGVEVTDESRRAARVLGYNSMEITSHSIAAISSIVSQLDRLTENMTPRAAAYLIKNGINPLDTNIEELNSQLEELNEELRGKMNPKDEDLKYSEYLWKLEKKGNITKAERNAYVQLYRVIEHINRQDGRAAGAVTKVGAELTLANLYSAIKTFRAGGVDKKVDDSLGLLESGYTEDDLTIYMENVANIMNDDSLHYEYKNERLKEKMDNILKKETMSEQEFMRIVTGMEGTSVNNIYSAIMASDSQLYNKMRSLKDTRIAEACDKVADIWKSDSESTEEQVVSSYMNLKIAAEATSTETTYEKAILKSDIRQAVSMMAKQAENKSYYVPMEIGGDTTMVHMTFKQGSKNERGKISIFTETTWGKISVHMVRKAKDYEIYATTDSEELKDRLSVLMEGTIVLSKKVSNKIWPDMEASAEEAEETTYGELVRQSKYFIHNVLQRL